VNKVRNKEICNKIPTPETFKEANLTFTADGEVTVDWLIVIQFEQYRKFMKYDDPTAMKM
jgi:hypothetical protein